MLTGHLNKAEFYVLRSPEDETQGWSKSPLGHSYAAPQGQCTWFDLHRHLKNHTMHKD